jgi:hypothetical protein
MHIEDVSEAEMARRFTEMMSAAGQAATAATSDAK